MISTLILSVNYWICQPGVSIWLPCYWISLQVLRRQNSFYVLPDLTSIPKVLPIIIKLARLLFVVFSAKNLKYEVHNEAKIIVMIFGLTFLSTRKYHSRSKQRTDQRVLVLTLKLLALKNWFFPP